MSIEDIIHDVLDLLVGVVETTQHCAGHLRPDAVMAKEVHDPVLDRAGARLCDVMQERGERDDYGVVVGW